MIVLSYLVTVFAAYLLGSIPTGFLVGKAKGVDIRTVGSKNMGATNVFRSVGRSLGILVLLVDIVKGWAAVALISKIAPHLLAQAAPDDYLRITAGIGAILGHNYTCWLKFKGGKGIATTGGAMAALVPWAFLIVVGVFIVLFLATRYVSVGSMVAAAVLPFATWFTTRDMGLTALAAVLGGLAILKHKKNIQRLMDGTENRIEFRKTEAAK